MCQDRQSDLAVSIDKHPITLVDLVRHPLWVAWRNEQRGNGLTKVPYSAVQKPARSDDPATWLPHDQVAFVAEAIDTGLGGGVGIQLRQCGGVSLAGIDLDTCRDPKTGDIEPWAQGVIDRIASYPEVSPSEKGVKIILLIESADIAELRRLMGTQHGRQWRRANGAEHSPAIELHISNRYFAVTWECLPDASPDLRIVPLDDLRWLIEQAGPAFAGKSEGTSAGKSEGPSSSEGHTGNTHILARLHATALTNQSVATALRNAATMHGGSRSEGAMGLGAALKRAGWFYDDMKAALLACPATKEWAQEKLFEGDRQFQRIWDRAGEGNQADPPPDGDWYEEFSEIPQAVTLADFLAAAKPPEFLIDPLIQRGFLYTLTAQTFHGKTSTEIYAALCVASTMAFAGHHTERGRVVYFAGENPDDIAVKFTVACAFWNLAPRTLAITVIPGAFDLANNINQALALAAAGGPVAMVVIDTSAAYRFDDDEDNNQASKLWAQKLRLFTRLPGHPAVIVPVHPTKAAEREGLLPRGGGAFLNEVDGNLTLWADLDAGTTVLHWKGKLRGPAFSPVSLDFRLHSHPTWRHRDDQPVKVAVVVPSGLMTGARTATRPFGHLKPMYRRWHDALLNALIVSPTTGVTTKKAWFDECVRLGLTEHPAPDDSRPIKEKKRAPFRDAVSKLVQAGWVGVNGEVVHNLYVRPKDDNS
jgi:hypothetical protein